MDQEIIQVVELLMALAAAVVAYWQHRQKLGAEVARDEAILSQHVADEDRIEAETERDTVVAFFDPEDETVTKPPDTILGRSWKMSDETKRWVTAGHSAEEQASLLKQIAEAEEQQKMNYFLSVPSAYYEIEYGLVKGGGSGGK